MKLNLAGTSWLLLGISALLLVVLTSLDPVLGGIPVAAQRWITFLALVVPPGAGAALGVMSLIHREGRAWLAVCGIVLNTLFALFHLMIVFFAG